MMNLSIVSELECDGVNLGLVVRRVEFKSGFALTQDMILNWCLICSGSHFLTHKNEMIMLGSPQSLFLIHCLKF